jgi:hypothetical protein
MKEKKLKCYVIMIAKNFPATHPRAGELTYFSDLIDVGIMSGTGIEKRKIHTIRKNYLLWKKRITEVQAGRAYLSLREWEGRPYHSRQVEIWKLTAADGVGVQELRFENVWDAECASIFEGNKRTVFTTYPALYENDGLLLIDFESWFKIKGNAPYAIIHFTPFRYL